MTKRNAITVSLVSFVVGMAAMWGVDRGTHAAPIAATKEPARPAGAASPRPTNPGAVLVELFVMSQCPYGVQAENGFKDAVAKLGADIDLRLEFIGDGSGSSLSSMHGPKEVKGDIAQLCAAKYTPRWFDLVLCQNKDPQAVDTNWKSCATEVGAEVGPIAACVEGPEGKELLSASFQRSRERGATGSPTVYVAGKPYEGARRSNDLIRAICSSSGDRRPAACDGIPEPAKVDVTILSDKRCEECDTKRLEAAIRQKVPNPVIKTVDYGDAEGKKLFATVKPATLPAIVVDDSVDRDEDAAAAFASARRAGAVRVVDVGEWNPVCADKDGCKADECKNTLACRAEVPKKLEVFVMSQCPYGVKALDAMHEVLTHFDKKGETLDFAIHFIGDGDAKSGLSSMHGPAEVAEDLREICAAEHYGKRHAFMEYVWCRNKNIRDAEWKSCATSATGVDADVIKTCSEGDEGKRLLEKSFAASKAAGISASPTWLVNGKFQFSGIDAETVRKNLCAHNKLAGCDATLSSAAPEPGGKACN